MKREKLAPSAIICEKDEKIDWDRLDTACLGYPSSYQSIYPYTIYNAPVDGPRSSYKPDPNLLIDLTDPFPDSMGFPDYVLRLVKTEP